MIFIIIIDLKKNNNNNNNNHVPRHFKDIDLSFKNNYIILGTNNFHINHVNAVTMTSFLDKYKSRLSWVSGSSLSAT
jgi:hypothetical protein